MATMDLFHVSCHMWLRSFKRTFLLASQWKMVFSFFELIAMLLPMSLCCRCRCVCSRMYVMDKPLPFTMPNVKFRQTIDKIFCFIYFQLFENAYICQMPRAYVNFKAIEI